MKITASYDVTQAMQEDSVRQYFWRILLRPKLPGIIVVVCAFVAIIAMNPPFKPWMIGFFSAAVIFLVASWVRTYIQIVAHARAGLKLMENPRVDLLLDDVEIEYSSSTGTRKHRWDKVEYVEETKGFMVLMNGKLPLLSLPKSSLPEEAIQYLRRRCRTRRYRQPR